MSFKKQSSAKTKIFNLKITEEMSADIARAKKKVKNSKLVWDLNDEIIKLISRKIKAANELPEVKQEVKQEVNEEVNEEVKPEVLLEVKPEKYGDI